MKIRTGNRIALLSGILLLLAGINAPAQFFVRGTVTDRETRQPLTGAHVRVGNTYLAVVTDGEGKYRIEGLKSTEDPIIFSYVGYTTLTVRLTRTIDTILDAALEPRLILGEEVNIIATRVQRETPATFSTIPTTEIEKVNLGKDMPYVLQSTPSVVTTSDAGTGIGYTGLSIRGTDLTRINVTMNGIPVNDAESQGVWFVDLPDLSSSTENIQVQRGVGTSTNGAGAFGASVNIQTSNLQEMPFGEISSSAGSYSTFRNTFRFGSGRIGEHFSFDGRLSYISSEGYIDRASARLRSFFISGGYLGKSTTLKFNILSGHEKTYQAWIGVPKDSLSTNRTYNPAGEYTDLNGNTAYYDNQTDNYTQTHCQLIFSQAIGSNFNLNAALHYTLGYGYYENYEPQQEFSGYGLDPVIVGTDTITITDMITQKYLDNDFYGLTFSGNWDNRKNLKVTVGGSFNRYDGRHYGRIIWAQYASDGGIDKNWYYSTGLKNDLNLFGKMNLRVASRFHLFADLQYRYIYYRLEGTLDDLRTLDQLHEFNFFNPKAGVFVDLTDRQTAYLSFGIGNREPSRNNYKDADPDRMPSHETLYDLELGYNLNLKKFATGINLYYMKYKDQLILTGEINDVGEAVMTNVPDSYRLGLELTANARIFRWLKWQVNATISRNRIRSFTEYVDDYDSSWHFTGQVMKTREGTNLSFSPGINIMNGLTFIPVKNLTIDLVSRYVGRQYIDNTSDKDRSLHPWFVNDLAIRYIIHTKAVSEIGLNLVVNNLFSEKYESNAWVYRYYYAGQPCELNGYFPQAPIHFLFGLTLKFI